MSRQLYWTKNGRWYSAGREMIGPPLDSSTPLPVLAEVEWSSLSPVSSENLGTTLNRISGSTKRVHMPTGTYIIKDNVMINNYSVYAPYCSGLRGDGIDKTILQLTPNSFTYQVLPPAQAGSGLIRLGPSRAVRTISDLTILGSVQTGPDGRPMFAGGYQNYYGIGEFWKNVKMRGVAYGGGNSPKTGETFAINCYKDIDSVFEDVEVDGRDASGNRIAGSPLGANNSTNLILRRCYLHDSLYSGLTASIAGSTASPTNGFITEDCRIANNANHPNVGAGSRFSGINHEHVIGTVRHSNVDILLDSYSLWDANHISLGGDIGDNKTVLIDNPNWHGLGPTWANGAFVVSMWGKQVTPPAVKNADGSLKTPVIVTGQNPPKQNINPLTQYAVSVGTGYVAP